MGDALGVIDGGVEVFQFGGVSGKLFEGFAGGTGGEAGVDELSEGALKVFGIFKMGGGVGDADFSVEVGEGEGDLVDGTESFGDGGFGDRLGNLALGEFAADPLGAEEAKVAAAVGVGFGEAFVVEQAGFFEAGEDAGDFAGIFGTGFEFLFEFGDGGRPAAEGAKSEVHEGFPRVEFRHGATHGHIKIVCNNFGSGERLWLQRLLYTKNEVLTWTKTSAYLISFWALALAWR